MRVSRHCYSCHRCDSERFRYNQRISDLENVPAEPPGEAFEEMCWGLLRRRYRPTELVKIPAEIGGDCGIEGFSTDGIAYQCFADRDSLSLRARTDKQIEKLNRDTLKLQKHREQLIKIFAPIGIAIHDYFLLVPQYHAAELVQHASKRSAVVVGWKLPFIGDDFMIHIKVPADYPAELRAAQLDGAARAVVPAPAIDEPEVSLFAREKPDLIQRLEKKLSSIAADPEDLRELRDKLVRAFLAKEQLLEALKDWPETWEAVEARRLLRQEQLEIDNVLSPDSPQRRIMGLIDGYRDDLISTIASLREPDAARIARGQVGDWLMSCPLRFPVVVPA